MKNLSPQQLSLSMYVLGYIVALFISLLFRQKYHMSRARVILYSLTITYGFLCAMIGGKIFTLSLQLRGMRGGSTSSIFGAVLFTPVLEIATVSVEKAIRNLVARKRGRNKPLISIRDTLDMLTPNIFLILLFGKLRCAWAGCCFGFPCSWGIHSPFVKDSAVFPVQLFEAATTLIVLLICFKVKESSFFRRGMAYPLTAAFYCAARFSWEFARYYEPEVRNFYLGLTFWQWACILVFVSSVISIAWLYKTKPSEPLPTINLRPDKVRSENSQ